MGNACVVRGVLLTLFMVLIPLLFPPLGYGKTNPKHYEFSMICESCHSELYDQWEDSYHAVSWEDSLFQDWYAPVRAESGEVKCLSCHAPVAWNTGDGKVMASISREGVNCDYCHTLVSERGGEENPDFEPRPGETKTGRSGAGRSIYHEIKAETDFGGAGYCASCHDLRNRFGVVIYSEYESWRRSPYAKRGITCRDCHMPESATRASNFGKVRDDVSGHRFQGWRSEENLRKACEFKANLQVFRDFVRLETAVTNRGAGHNFPGGTPLRELVIRVTGMDDAGDDLFEENPIQYGVNLEIDGEDSLNLWQARSVISDNRLRPGEKREGSVSIPRDENLRSIKVSLLYYPIPLHVVEEKGLDLKPLVIYERRLVVR